MSDTPELTAAERDTVARFEAAPWIEEAWEEPFDDIYTVGQRIDVYEVDGGYLVAPLNRGMGLS